MLNYKAYSILFSYLPKSLIPIRYLLSISLRLLGLFSAVKLLSLKNIYRQLLLGMCYFNLIFIWFKHPVKVARIQMMHFDPQQLNANVFTWVPGFKYIDYAWRYKIYYSFFDIVFALFIIFLLNRKAIKEIFVKSDYMRI